MGKLTFYFYLKKHYFLLYLNEYFFAISTSVIAVKRFFVKKVQKKKLANKILFTSFIGVTGFEPATS